MIWSNGTTAVAMSGENSLSARYAVVIVPGTAMVCCFISSTYMGRAATTIGAQIIRQEGKLGTLKAGAYADLLLIDGDPLKNLGLFQEQGKHLAAIMKGGRFHKNQLN